MAWLAYSFACLAVVSSTSCSYSLHKQLTEELEVAQPNPGAVLPRSVMSGEVADREKCCRQNSSPGSLTDLNHSPAMMNSPAAVNLGSGKDSRHSQKCNASEQRDSLNSSQVSVDSPAGSQSQLYVFTYFLYKVLCFSMAVY